MFKGEKWTILLVLSIYLTSTFFLVFTVFGTYFYIEKEKYKVALEKEFEEDTVKLHNKLQTLHETSFKQRLEYPRFEEFKSAIYDSDKNLIFSNIEHKNIDFSQKLYRDDDSVIFIHNVTPYYLGAAYIVLEKKELHF